MTELAERQETPIAETSETGAMMNAIIRMASDPQTDVDKFERLIAVQERMMAKQAEQSFHAAMNLAQSEMGRVSADATNPQTRSKYATYAALDRALRPVYSQHGFSLSFDTGDAPRENEVRVVCNIAHRDGHRETRHVDMPADGKGIKGNTMMTSTHASGSAMSYGMRYLLKLIFNVAVGENDDDGNHAGARPVSADQAATIQAKLDETGADTARFLRAVGTKFSCGRLDNIEQIPAMFYDDVIGMIEANAKRKAQ